MDALTSFVYTLIFTPALFRKYPRICIHPNLMTNE